MSLLTTFTDHNTFVNRHNGPTLEQQQTMLAAIGVDSLDQLIDQTVPANIRLPQPLQLPKAINEEMLLQQLKHIAQKNIINKSYIGQGYYNTYTPSVILRNILENPGWYTAYTPYQPEISQGRLESLLNYQQMVMDLTGMDLANASLLDESTAAAEAMMLCKRASKNKSPAFFVSNEVHPQTLDVIRTRAKFVGIEVITGNLEQLDNSEVFGALLQYPGSSGEIHDLTAIIANAHAKKTLVAVASDLLALTLLTPSGEMGADVVVGSAQRFGVPMDLEGLTQALWQLKINTSVLCLGELSAYQKTVKVTKLYVWQCKLVSSISAVKKRLLISVLPKLYLPIWLLSTRCITVLKV